MPKPPVVAANDPRGRAPAGGGMGIGLPFTGPSGEPIFGLTPEQRLGQAKPARRKWLLYGAIAAMAIVIGVAIAVLTKPTTKKLDPNTPAGQASEA